MGIKVASMRMMECGLFLAMFFVAFSSLNLEVKAGPPIAFNDPAFLSNLQLLIAQGKMPDHGSLQSLNLDGLLWQQPAAPVQTSVVVPQPVVSQDTTQPAGYGSVVNAGTVSVAAGSRLIIPSSAASLTKTGPGTLILTGINTYTGATTINAGTIRLGNSSAIGTATGNLSVENGTLTLSGDTTFSGSTVVSGGTLNVSGSALTVNGANNLTINSGSVIEVGGTKVSNTSILNINQPTTGTLRYVTLSGADTSFGGTSRWDIRTDSNPSMTISGGATLANVQLQSVNLTSSVTSGARLTLTKAGSGTLSLSGTSIYAGSTTLAGGVLDVSGCTVQANTVSPLLVTGTGTLDVNTISNGALTISGGTTVLQHILPLADQASLTLDDVSDAGTTLTATTVEDEPTAEPTTEELCLEPASSGLRALTVVPEPSTILLLITAGLGLVAVRKMFR